MGTIAEKLTYLNTTKTMLRDSLNKFGSNILSTDTFRSYDTKLNEIYDKLPKVTGSGSEFTLIPVQNGQVDDFKMNGVDLEQSETPTPDSPQEIKVVEGRQVITDKGKNLLNISKNVNGYWYKNGVLTANADWSYINDFIEVKASTQYTISRDSSELNESQFSIEEFDKNKNYIKQNVLWQNNTNKYTITTASNTKYVICNYRNGYAHTNLQFESGDNRTDYEPYHEPVDYNIDLHGKNVFNLEKYPFTPKVAYSSTGYQELNWTGYSGIKDYFPINGNTTYSFSNSTGLDIYYGLVFYDKNKTIISNITAHTTTFTTPSNCEYIRFSIHTEELPTWVQIEEGSTTTNYEEYYDYKLAKMPNTDYKNRIYKNNGNWYFEENVRKYIIDGTESWTTQSAYSGYYRYMFVLMENYKNDNLSYGVVGMNSHFIQRITQPHGDYEYLYLQAVNNNLLSVYIQIKNLSTIANFKTWLSENNVVVWYPLTNPVTTQITNTTLIDQLEAISLHTGTNIITISNDNNMTPEIEITRLKELERMS